MLSLGRRGGEISDVPDIVTNIGQSVAQGSQQSGLSPPSPVSVELFSLPALLLLLPKPSCCSVILNQKNPFIAIKLRTVQLCLANIIAPLPSFLLFWFPPPLVFPCLFPGGARQRILDFLLILVFVSELSVQVCCLTFSLYFVCHLVSVPYVPGIFAHFYNHATVQQYYYYCVRWYHIVIIIQDVDKKVPSWLHVTTVL